MRDVAVLGIVVLPVRIPLDEIALGSYLERVQSGTDIFPYLTLTLVSLKCLACFNAACQQVP